MRETTVIYPQVTEMWADSAAGPHGGHAGKLINSTANGSTSPDLPVKTHDTGLERQQQRTGTKEHLNFSCRNK